MFRSDSVVEDEYIREYAFEPELLINRHDYLKQEQQRVQSSTAAAAARLDDTYHQHRRYSFDIYDEYKNQVDVEIEAFYHREPQGSKKGWMESKGMGADYRYAFSSHNSAPSKL
uniref:Uncharacterized protein n=1 Tax=Glossina palpalis gambiensis TaxID=67801 RepID=A0A1B0BKN9_9MUSC